MSRQTKRLSFDEERPFWTTVVTIFAVLAGLFVVVPIISYLSGAQEAEAAMAVEREAAESGVDLPAGLVGQARTLGTTSDFEDRDMQVKVFSDEETEEVTIEMSFPVTTPSCYGINQEQGSIVAHAQENIEADYDHLRIRSYHQGPSAVHYDVTFDRDAVEGYSADDAVTPLWDEAEVASMPSHCLESADRGNA